jgi:uncharacterized membrane protein YesL
MKQLTDALQVIQQSLSDWWHSWLTLAILNTLLVLCWITVVLGPPATFGLYHAAHSLTTTYSTDWREFVAGSKRYFLKSWLWMLVNVAVALLLRISVEFYSQFAETTVLLLFALLIGFLWFCAQFYIIPYLMQQEQKQLRLAFRNGFLTLFASPVYTLILLLPVTVALWLGMSFPILFVIGSPAFIVVLGTHAVRQRLKTFRIVDAGEEYIPASDDEPL